MNGTQKAEIIQSGSVVEALTRGEVDMQVKTAKAYPRSLETFRQSAKTLALKDRDVAGSCFYSIPRGGKMIEGPSVRLAEIVATCWGNLRAETRIVSTDASFITAQATCWDMENNVLIRTEVQRRIKDKNGKTYNDDMITVTGNAAASIALRNAVFKVVPFSHVKGIYDEAKLVSVGQGLTLEQSRTNMLAWFAKVGVAETQILEHLKRKSLIEVTLEDCVQLRGIATAIQDGELQAAEAFAAATPPEGAHGFGKRAGAVTITPEAADAPGATSAPQPVSTTPSVTVHEKLKDVRSATSGAELDQLAKNEPRKTLIRAIEKRREQLGITQVKTEETPASEPEEKPQATAPMAQSGLIQSVAAARAATTAEQLGKLYNGEERKEVLDAISKRLTEINNGIPPHDPNTGEIETPSSDDDQGGFGFGA